MDISRVGRLTFHLALVTTLSLAAAVSRAEKPAVAPAVAAADSPADSPAKSPDEEATDLVDPAAVAIAARSGDFLRDAKRFSFSAESGYEVVQTDGSKLEFGATRHYQVQRPDRMRVETAPRDGDRRITLFDGKTFVQVVPAENVYAKADLKEPRDIDFMIDFVRERLDTPLPLAELLRNDPRKAFEDSLESAQIVGKDHLRGVDCDHLALRNPDTDIQFWIARGDHPLLRRIVITYRHLEGQPSFWADLDDWDLAPKLKDSLFRYVPEKGAERVRFDVRPSPRPDSAPRPGSEEGS